MAKEQRSRHFLVLTMMFLTIRVSHQFMPSRSLPRFVKRSRQTPQPVLFFSNTSSEVALKLVQSTFNQLANRNRSWKRLNHIVELALNVKSTTAPDRCRSLTDIGTDHGLLSYGLATSGMFDQIIGVDASMNALNDGALRLEKELKASLNEAHEEEDSLLSPTNMLKQVEFRHGNGLAVLEPGEADIVCIAGMGVKTMIEILSATLDDDADSLRMDELGCQHLILQPTNSRPRNLSTLYKKLSDAGWIPKEERIKYLSKRWYLTTHFCRLDAKLEAPRITHSPLCEPPCSLLLRNYYALDEEEHESLEGYISHHKDWLEREQHTAGKLDPADTRWLTMINDNNDRYYGQ